MSDLAEKKDNAIEQQKDTVIERQKGVIKYLEEQIYSLRDKLHASEEFHKKYDELVVEYSELNLENVRLKSKIESLEHDAKARQAQFEDALAEVDRVKAAYDVLAKDKAEAQEAVDAYRTSLGMGHFNANVELGKAEIKNRTLLSDLDKVRAKNRILLSDLDKVRAEKGDCLLEIDKLKTELKNTQLELKDRNAELIRLNAKLFMLGKDEKSNPFSPPWSITGRDNQNASTWDKDLTSRIHDLYDLQVKGGVSVHCMKVDNLDDALDAIFNFVNKNDLDCDGKEKK